MNAIDEFNYSFKQIIPSSNTLLKIPFLTTIIQCLKQILVNQIELY